MCSRPPAVGLRRQKFRDALVQARDAMRERLAAASWAADAQREALAEKDAAADGLRSRLGTRKRTTVRQECAHASRSAYV